MEMTRSKYFIRTVSKFYRLNVSFHSTLQVFYWFFFNRVFFRFDRTRFRSIRTGNGVMEVEGQG